MDIITYTLKSRYTDSSDFYKVIKEFKEEVVTEADKVLDTAIEGYMSYVKNKDESKLLSRDEYILELLCLGTFYNIYGKSALNMNVIPGKLLKCLSNLRRHSSTIKTGIDFLRGIMFTLFLHKNYADDKISPDCSVSQLKKLIQWMDASGEIFYESKRIKGWYRYLSTCGKKSAADILASIIMYAQWFRERSQEVLGIYTQNIETFFKSRLSDHRWKEDIIFCGRQRTEYHLNMIGAQIMNDAFRKRFVNCSKKLVVVPACMRLYAAINQGSNTGCMSDAGGKAYSCKRCTNECNISKLTSLSHKYGFEVLVIPHESSLVQSGSKLSNIDSDTGVVGVSCVLNLISGGWMLQDMGIAAQCVILDYCGCRNHWDDRGFPTEINVEQLMRILDIKNHTEVI